MPQPISKTPSSSCPPHSACCSHFRCILLSILVLVAGLSAGLYIGGQGSSQSNYNPPSSVNNTSGQRAEVKKGSYEDGYQAALDFARKRLESKGMFGLSSKSGRSMLSRVVVKSVSGNIITVEFDASILDVFSEGPVTKTIVMPDAVKIEKRTPKDPEEVKKAFDEYFKEQEELRKNTKTQEEMKNLSQPPTTYTVDNINISDLKEGDLLNIFYEVDAAKPDIFNAVSVELINDQKFINKIGVDLNNIPATVPVAEPNSDKPEAIPSAETIPQAESLTDTPSASAEAPAATETVPSQITE